MNNKAVLCLDFDGVCHSYVSGWQGVTNIPDEPVEGLWDFLEEADKHFDLHIFSSRSSKPGGVDAMVKWFCNRKPDGVYALGVSNSSVRTLHFMKIHEPVHLKLFTLHFPVEKPAAFLTIDDRAITFTGKWPSMLELQSFKVWYK